MSISHSMIDLRDKTYSAFVRRAIFPLHERVKRHSTVRMLREMEREQWLTPGDLRQVQGQRLNRLLTHAFENVPYYRDLLRDLGFGAGHFQTEDDLAGLPFLDKTAIRNHLEHMRDRDSRRTQKFSTGGSTGVPLIFYLGPTRVSSDVAARCRAESWFGLGVGDREYVIWGAPLELDKQDRWRQARDRVMCTKLLSAFEMSPSTMDAYLDEMERHGCRRVFGYPSSIALLCEHARRQGRDLSRLGVQAVFVTAEFLWDHWRETIAATFGCTVANGYGGRDSGFIAHECSHGGMHITADRLLVETVAEDGRRTAPGELGEIVVTHFDTPEMPFIRYRTGDMGALSSERCACGRTLPLLEKIEGRKSDFIVTPDGRVMHGLALIYVLRKVVGVEQFRITQKSVNEFHLELVTSTDFRRESELAIRDEFQQRLRAPVNVHIHYSSTMPVGKNGKFRYVVSEVGKEGLDLVPATQ
jgi:phenylacetate-CoA ligase